MSKISKYVHNFLIPQKQVKDQNSINKFNPDDDLTPKFATNIFSEYRSAANFLHDDNSRGNQIISDELSNNITEILTDMLDENNKTKETTSKQEDMGIEACSENGTIDIKLTDLKLNILEIIYSTLSNLGRHNEISDMNFTECIVLWVISRFFF